MEGTSGVGDSARASGLGRHCHTGGHYQGIRVTLPGLQGREDPDPVRWGYCQHVTDQGHIQNGGHSAALGRSTGRGLPDSQNWGVFPNWGHCQENRMEYPFKVGDTARESGLEGRCHMGGYYHRGRDGETR